MILFMIFIFPSIGQPCSLFCKPKDPQYRFSAKLASKVIDGTSCSSGSIDICIDGRCQVSLFDLCHMEYLESEILRRRRRKVVMVACAFIKLSSIALFNRIRSIALVFQGTFPLSFLCPWTVDERGPLLPILLKESLSLSREIHFSNNWPRILCALCPISLSFATCY